MSQLEWLLHGLHPLSSLVVGKAVGIIGAAWLACRLGWAELAPDGSWRDVAGVAALGGIGFTVSLFIAGLAFDNGSGDGSLVADLKVGILAASVLATALGTLIVRTGCTGRRTR